MTTMQTGEPPDVRAVRAADESWAKAAASKDVERMLAWYDEAAVFISPAGVVISGTERLRELWTAFFARPGYALKWRATRVDVSEASDLGYSYGTWEQAEQVGEQAHTSSGVYLAVWKRQANGGWKVLVDKP